MATCNCQLSSFSMFPGIGSGVIRLYCRTSLFFFLNFDKGKSLSEIVYQFYLLKSADYRIRVMDHLGEYLSSIHRQNTRFDPQLSIETAIVVHV